MNTDFFGLDDSLSDDEKLAMMSVRKFVQAEIEPVIAQCYEEGVFPMDLVPKFGELRSSWRKSARRIWLCGNE